MANNIGVGTVGVKFAVIDTATDGATLVAAVTGKKIRVLGYHIQLPGGANTYTFKSDSTEISGSMDTAAAPDTTYGCFETAEGEALKIGLGSATQVDGHLSYIEV